MGCKISFTNIEFVSVREIELMDMSLGSPTVVVII